MKKSKANDLIRMHHMRDATQAALDFVKARQRSTLDEDMMLAFAIVRALGIIGEAASQVTDEARMQYSQIPWVDIIGMRNWLVHAYFAVDLDTVWDTVTQDLPGLLKELDKLIQAVGE